MKQIGSILFVIAIMIIGVTVYAASTVTTQIDNGNFTVSISGNISSGKMNQPVTLCVTGSMPGAPADMIHVDQQLTGTGGAYLFNFIINPDAAVGICNYTVTASGDTPDSVLTDVGTFNVVDVSTIATAIQSINRAVSVDDITSILKGLDSDSLVLNFGLFDQITDKSMIAGALYNYVKNDTTGVGFSMCDQQHLDTFYNMIRRYTVLTAFNEGLSGQLIQNGKLSDLNYLEPLSHDYTNQQDFTQAQALYADALSNYNGSLSPTGISNVNRNMFRISFTSIEQAATELEKLIYTNAITNNIAVGTGYIDTIIMQHGALLGLDVSKYIACSDKMSIYRALISSGAQTPSDLVTAFNKAISVTPRIFNQNSGGGDGGGNSGGSGNFIAATTPINVELLSQGISQQAADTFSDIDGVQWAKAAINELKSLNIINGKSTTLFAPNDYVTREEFLKMLLNALKLNNNPAYALPYEDVSSSDWYYPYIKSATKLGIVQGISESDFGVGQDISRQDMLTLAFRALKSAGVSTDVDTSSISFADQNDIAGYSLQPIKSLKKMSIISGYPDGTIKPNDKATRAEAAVLISNLLKLKVGAK